ncbi:putative xylanase/chitin deacetylase [Mycobacterium tuberculosis]|nr:putative xylanase/chitin deacetylase [Mycobacterium tuberculosis]
MPKRPDNQTWRYWRTVTGVVVAGAVLVVGGRGRRTQRGPVISSSISVTSAAIGERSLRSKVMWANNG